MNTGLSTKLDGISAMLLSFQVQQEKPADIPVMSRVVIQEFPIPDLVFACYMETNDVGAGALICPRASFHKNWLNTRAAGYQNGGLLFQCQCTAYNCGNGQSHQGQLGFFRECLHWSERAFDY